LEGSDKQLERIVLGYLRQKGYKSSLQTFVREAKLDSVRAELVPGQDADVGAFLVEIERDRSAISWLKSYQDLEQWADCSLDAYKPEFRGVLWPTFVHAYLDLVGNDMMEHARRFLSLFAAGHMDYYAREIERLKFINTTEHFQESEFVQQWRTNKFALQMSAAGFRLLLNFLKDGKHDALLKILNDRISIESTVVDVQ
jgi:transcription initiation factor TFIID subunit 5